MSSQAKVYITMTSCKRLEMFRRTVRSLVTHIRCTVPIVGCICFDDNSSEYDRQAMMAEFGIVRLSATLPAILFVNKTPETRGHATSMNMIRSHIAKLPNSIQYIFHMEDDFEATGPVDVDQCIKVLESDSGKAGHVMQCLFNLNYKEDPSEQIEGGILACCQCDPAGYRTLARYSCSHKTCPVCSSRDIFFIHDRIVRDRGLN